MPSLSKSVLFCIPFLFAASTAFANNYEQCIVIVDRSPDRAFEIAAEWRDYGGGAPAEHCMALALIGQGKAERAAELLDEMARTIKDDPASEGRTPEQIRLQRADLLTQAGNAWLLAEAPDKAYMRFTDALAEQGLPLDWRVETLTDRARAAADLNDQDSAVDDLTDALELGGPRPDVLTYRAAAQRALGAVVKAREDVDAALALNPDYYEALFERGHLNHQVGNDDAAIVDWLQVTYIAPDTPAALAAEANIKSVREARAASGQEGAMPPTPAAPPNPALPADAHSEVDQPDPAAPAP
ncbi:MAG: hypothetical protein ACE363_04405 [Alphaproteobacteria bacterium]